MTVRLQNTAPSDTGGMEAGAAGSPGAEAKGMVADSQPASQTAEPASIGDALPPENLSPGTPSLLPEIPGDPAEQTDGAPSPPAIPGPQASEEERNAFYAALGVPQTAEDYDLNVDDALGGADAAINQRLHDAHFTADQAQLVYDLAAEILAPRVRDVETRAADQAFDIARQNLAASFGGAENWHRLAPKIAKWGRENLPEAAYAAMAQSVDGVRALHRLMEGGREAPLGSASEGASGEAPRAEIRRLMNDPRYWRDGDPALVGQVQAAFSRLHGDGG